MHAKIKEAFTFATYAQLGLANAVAVGVAVGALVSLKSSNFDLQRTLSSFAFAENEFFLPKSSPAVAVTVTESYPASTVVLKRR